MRASTAPLPRRESAAAPAAGDVVVVVAVVVVTAVWEAAEEEVEELPWLPLAFSSAFRRFLPSRASERGRNARLKKGKGIVGGGKW